MGNKIFVGGLNWRTTEPDLKAAFSRCADVASVRIIIDRETGRSKCFGFIEFTDLNAVPEVIEKCDGMKLDGRHIKVSAARERPAPVKPAATPEDKEEAGEESPTNSPEASAQVSAETSSEVSAELKAQVETVQENSETNTHA
ncbi:MAG: RNA recognition motif domain-containing protein [Oligoflexales bacterium]